MVLNLFPGKKILKNRHILFAQKAGDGQAQAVIGQHRGHIDPLTPGICLGACNPIYPPRLKIGNRNGLVNGRIKGNGGNF
jgi:hypothetical protein